MSNVVISIENLGKKYRIRHQGEGRRYVALRDVIADKVTTPWRWLAQRGRSQKLEVSPLTSDLRALTAELRLRTAGIEDFWALRDVSFEVRQGEVVGIIGPNGAGKSTLLKILSRITEPTKGRARINGRVASLLEVGTGFHPELTGRENIFLNGAILGMTRVEMKNKFEEIVAFAGVDRFLDTPVKRYSSGMYVRLAFAVAAHLEPEILIVDEVLAVGDAEFQKKCLGKMGTVAQQGRTVLYVSHNLNAVANLCMQGILLESGCMVMSGSVQDVIRRYLAVHGTSEDTVKFDGKGRAIGEAVEILAAARHSPEAMHNGHEFSISFRVRFHKAVAVNFFFYLHREGTLAFVASDLHMPVIGGQTMAGQEVLIEWTVPPYLLNPGWHSFGMSVISPDASIYYAHVDEVLLCFIEDDNLRRGSTFHHAWGGAVCPLLRINARPAG